MLRKKRTVESQLEPAQEVKTDEKPTKSTAVKKTENKTKQIADEPRVLRSRNNPPKKYYVEEEEKPAKLPKKKVATKSKNAGNAEKPPTSEVVDNEAEKLEEEASGDKPARTVKHKAAAKNTEVQSNGNAKDDNDMNAKRPAKALKRTATTKNQASKIEIQNNGTEPPEEALGADKPVKAGKGKVATAKMAGNQDNEAEENDEDSSGEKQTKTLKRKPTFKIKAPTSGKQKNGSDKPNAGASGDEAAETRKRKAATTKTKAANDEEEEEAEEENSDEDLDGPTPPKRLKQKGKANKQANAEVPESEDGDEQLDEAGPSKITSNKETTKKQQTKTKVASHKVADATSESSEESDEEVPAKVIKQKAASKKAEATSSKNGLKNQSETNWNKIDFSCSKMNAKGKEFNLKITSWNVDGLRAWMKKGGLDIFKYDNPDILCLQETKCSEKKLPDEIKNVEGYHNYWLGSDKEGYAGVAAFTKTKPISVQKGIGSAEHDNEGRCLTLEFKQFYLVNVYVPNAGRGLVTLHKRLQFNEAFKTFINTLEKKKPVIVCGDMNVAHNEIDLSNPKSNKKNAGFTKEERDGMTDFLEDGYVDTYRELYPDQKNVYTFWSYMNQARSKNVGWRLDYFIVSAKIMEKVCDNIVKEKVFGSDHCPITLFINF